MAALVGVSLCECRKLQPVACEEIHIQQLQLVAASNYVALEPFLCQIDPTYLLAAFVNLSEKYWLLHLSLSSQHLAPPWTDNR